MYMSASTQYYRHQKEALVLREQKKTAKKNTFTYPVIEKILK